MCCVTMANARFHKRNYAPIEIVLTELKGYGLRAKENIPRWVYSLPTPPQWGTRFPLPVIVTSGDVGVFVSPSRLLSRDNHIPPSFWSYHFWIDHLFSTLTASGSLIYEYIGEVVKEQTFRKRMAQYAEEGIRHFYFMMLQKEEVCSDLRPINRTWMTR